MGIKFQCKNKTIRVVRNKNYFNGLRNQQPPKDDTKDHTIRGKNNNQIFKKF